MSVWFSPPVVARTCNSSSWEAKFILGYTVSAKPDWAKDHLFKGGVTLRFKNTLFTPYSEHTLVPQDWIKLFDFLKKMFFRDVNSHSWQVSKPSWIACSNNESWVPAPNLSIESIRCEDNDFS